MRDLYLLLWIYPRDKKIATDLKNYSFLKQSVSDYLHFVYERSTREISELKKVLESKEISFLTIQDNNYPKVLLNYDYAPMIFSYYGDIDGYLKSRPVAMIGSRKIDPSLEKWLYQSFNVSSDNHIYISGGAIGTDQVVHDASLKTNNKSLFVLPSGLLAPYPKGIMSRFRENKKALFVSQFSPYQRIYKSNFYARNYFMASLSESVVVLQAKIKSGTMVTLRYALDMNKNIFVLSCSPWDERYSGNKKIIEEGANQIINLDLFQ